MSFEAGEEIVASLSKDLPKAACGGVIIKPEPDEKRLQIALKGRGLILRHGSLIHVRSTRNPELSAWSSVQRVTLAGDVKIVDLTSVRLERKDRRRAARYPIELLVSAKGKADETTASRGYSIDLSVSGIKARFETPIPDDGPVHLVVHLDGSRLVEAMASVVRKEESEGDSQVIALEFQSFIKGYEYLADLIPSE